MRSALYYYVQIMYIPQISNRPLGGYLGSIFLTQVVALNNLKKKKEPAFQTVYSLNHLLQTTIFCEIS